MDTFRILLASESWVWMMIVLGCFLLMVLLIALSFPSEKDKFRDRMKEWMDEEKKRSK